MARQAHVKHTIILSNLADSERFEEMLEEFREECECVMDDSIRYESVAGDTLSEWDVPATAAEAN